jgi:sulfite reductase alpha subunit-like flavoprotein
MQSSTNSVTLLYASESGTAVDLSQRVAALAANRLLTIAPCGFDHVIHDGLSPVESFVAACNSSNGFAVLVVSTTGDGEMPKNMAKFWRSLLQKSLRPDTLRGIRYALYGLGDRGYGDKFCAAARKLDARLQQLGAVPLIPRELSDEQHPSGGVLAPFG